MVRDGACRARCADAPCSAAALCAQAALRALQVVMGEESAAAAATTSADAADAGGAAGDGGQRPPARGGAGGAVGYGGGAQARGDTQAVHPSPDVGDSRKKARKIQIFKFSFKRQTT